MFDEIKDGLTRGRIRLGLITTVMIAFGILGSIFNYLLPWEGAQHLARDFSVALFVAGLLALSVDIYFKT
jgi:hypothetical protein